MRRLAGNDGCREGMFIATWNYFLIIYKMVIRRSYRSRNLARSQFRRRRYTRRMKRVPRQIVRSSVANFKRTLYYSNWSFSTASTSGFYRLFSPSFGDLPNVSEYTALFDQYKVNAIKITFLPKFGSTDAGTVATPGQDQAYIHYYVDPYSVVGPTGTYGTTSFSAFLEAGNNNVKSKKLDKPVSVYFKPKIADQGISGQYKFIKCPWLSSSSTTTSFRQVFAYITDANFAAQTTVSVDVMMTYYFQCRFPK